MVKNKISLWYDEEGDYLEITLEKCKDTYFNENKKDYAEVIAKKTDEVVGYVIFNFTKRKKFRDIEIAMPKEITV